MTADVWGNWSNPRKAAPPLKSTRTKFSSSEEWVMASAATRVRSSSLLPDPVAPTSIPCGPIPDSADSLMSRSTGVPSSATPMGTRRRWREERASRTGVGSKVRASPTPNRVVSS